MFGMTPTDKSDGAQTGLIARLARELREHAAQSRKEQLERSMRRWERQRGHRGGQS